MRVIELWTNAPMRFGKGGNVMVSHLVEIPANAERTPQTWHHAPGKLPDQCVSLTMEADAHGVVVRVEAEGGTVTHTLVRDFASATIAESWHAAIEPLAPMFVCVRCRKRVTEAELTVHTDWDGNACGTSVAHLHEVPVQPPNLETLDTKPPAKPIGGRRR